MPKDSRENISSLTEEPTEYMMISLISNRINVLIVGGGRAGYIKAKAFLERGAMVTVVSKSFCNDIIELKLDLQQNESQESDSNIDMSSANCRLNLIENGYSKRYMHNKHLVVIATDNRAVNDEIKQHCNQMAKVFLNCEDYKEGLFVTPMQVKTRSVSLGLHTLGASPKTTKFLADRLKKNIKEYDEFVQYACKVRDEYKGNDLKDRVMDIINTEEFYLAFKNGNHDKLFKDKIGVEKYL